MLDYSSSRILRDVSQRLALEVDGIRFCVSIAEEKDSRFLGKIRQLAVSRRDSALPETHDAMIAEKIPTSQDDSTAIRDFPKQNSNPINLLAVNKAANPLMMREITIDEGEFLKNHLKMNQSAIGKEALGFHSTPGRKNESASCPTIKGTFGKLRNDLSTPINSQNTQFALIKKTLACLQRDDVPTNGLSNSRAASNGLLDNSVDPTFNLVKEAQERDVWRWGDSKEDYQSSKEDGGGEFCRKSSSGSGGSTRKYTGPWCGPSSI